MRAPLTMTLLVATSTAAAQAPSPEESAGPTSSPSAEAARAPVEAGPPAVPTEADTAERKARTWYEEGVNLFRSGQYVEAAEKFQLAYNLDPAPILLYNLARAHEEAQHLDDAALFFRSYLDRYPDAEDRADVERRIAALEERRRTEPPPPPVPEAPAPSAPAPEGPPVAAGADPDRVTVGLWAIAAPIGTFDYPDVDVLQDGGRTRIEGDSEDLQKSFGVGASVEFAFGRHFAAGARGAWSTGEAEEFGVTFSAFDVGPLVRGRLPLSGRLGLHALGYGGFTTASSDEADLDVGEVSLEGSGWHVGGGAGANLAVHRDIRLTLTLGGERQQLDLESNRIGNRRVELSGATFTRLTAELGVLFDL